MPKQKARFDEIGYWSEVKLEIVRKYASAYSTILSKQPGFTHFYIDGFAGAGAHISKTSKDWVPGSPLNALNVVPAFKHHFLIDLDGRRIETLRSAIGDRPDVTLLEGDCNPILLNEVLPRVRYQMRERALCLLDPYGLHLQWEVLAKAGQLNTIDLFLNFPIMDMNMNALWAEPNRASPDQAARLTAFWGDDSWRTVVYRPSRQEHLFGEETIEKAPNQEIVQAFRERLRKVAGFKNVPEPMPMRNSTRAVVYYLFFASQNDAANKIVREIFDRYRHHGLDAGTAQ